jgi:hypothetical protein
LLEIIAKKGTKNKKAKIEKYFRRERQKIALSEYEMEENMRNLLFVCTLPFLLFAQEQPSVKKEEGGLLHTKQEGRYDVVVKLPEKAAGFDQSFDYAKPFATFRLANVSTWQEGLENYAIEKEKKYGTSLGGIFGLKTASLHGFTLRLGAYASQKITALNPDDPQRQNIDLFDADGDSYAYIGEAALTFNRGRFQAKVGRIRIDTPYADSDDIRMSPNSFEGAWGYLDLGGDWQSELYLLTRWAGFDSGEDQNLFKPFVEDGYGLAGGSLTYMFNDDNAVSLWYYMVDRESDIVYADWTGQIYLSEAFHMEWGAQGAHIRERAGSGVEGDVVGAMLIADYDVVYLGGAYNYVFQGGGMTVTDGFGGGPYYTSLDEQTIGAFSVLAPGEDFGVVRIGLGFDFSSAGIKQLNLEFVHGHFFFTDYSEEVKENDVVLTYDMSDRWYLESVYSNIDFVNIGYTDVDNRELRDFQRLVARLDYRF